MKKILLFCSFILLLNTKSHSQTFPEFAPLGATWNYMVYEINGSAWTFHFTSVDTAIIDGKHGKKINAEYAVAPYFFVYRDSLQMYASFDSISWKLIYDFSKQVGDSFISHVNYPNEDSVVVEVTARGDTLIGGFQIPYLRLHSTNPAFYVGGKVLLNIGGEDFFFANSTFMDPSINGLRCFHDSLIGEFFLVSPCDTVISIGISEILGDDNLISIYPNPVNENLFIQKSKLSNSASVQVFKYTGQLVLEIKNFKEENIDTQNLQNGFYVLKYSDGNNYSVKKFLVQH